MNRLRLMHLRRRPRLATIVLVMLALALVISPVMAQEPPGVEAEQEGDSELDILSPAQYWEPRPYDCGCHAAAGGSLTNHAWHEAWGTCKVLDNCNWINRYIYNKYLSWERDFKRAALGGTENNYLDQVDLQFYVGHGNPGTFTFWNDNYNDCCLRPPDCYRSWGDIDNEYVALTSCSVLGGNTSQLRAWANCGLGTHLILGFKTGAAARYPYYRTTGYWFARYLCAGYTVVQAWDKAADRTQPAGRVVRTLINELTYMNERPRYGYVRTYDSTDWDWWVHTHTAGSESARQVDIEALNYTVPRFEYAPFSLAEAEAKYETLGNVFGVTTTVQAAVQQAGGPSTVWSDTTNNRELEMDSGSGLYGYTDLQNWLTYTPTKQVYLQGATMTAQDAREIADQFLTDNGLMPEDAQFYEVAEDTISGGEIVTGSVGALQASWLAEEPVVYQVIYSRILSYTPPTIAGVEQESVDFVVVGPGAKLKVYVPSTAAAVSALSSNNSVPVLGAIGGWRQTMSQAAGVGTQSLETIEVRTPAQIYKLHEQLRETVVLDPQPFQFDEMEILTHTVTYWEEGAGSSQSESTPIYELTVRFTLDDEEVGVDKEHIAAEETYMPPFARIASAPTEKVEVGQTVTLTATNAATTLADLGYDSSLDFMLGSGIEDDYLYEWYLGSPDETNRIGVGRSIDYTVAPDITQRNGNGGQRIILKVTDTANPDFLSNTDSTVIEVYPRLFLPMLLRNY